MTKNLLISTLLPGADLTEGELSVNIENLLDTNEEFPQTAEGVIYVLLRALQKNQGNDRARSLEVTKLSPGIVTKEGALLQTGGFTCRFFSSAPVSELAPSQI